jgi:predicted ribosomally synthesized peptide with SipW-like signal peptide
MKKKIFGITLAIALIVLMIAGTSMAYFTDVEDATNVFTSGNVDIELAYNGSIGNADSTDGTIALITDQNVYPNKLFKKTVKINNVGSENAYVGAIITITDDKLGELITANGRTVTTAGGETIATTPVASFLSDIANMGNTVKVAEGTNEIKIYVIVGASIAKDEVADIFDKIRIPSTWDNAEMAKFNGLKITVNAYATQTKGFEGINGAATAKEALTAAFADWEAFALLP